MAYICFEVEPWAADYPAMSILLGTPQGYSEPFRPWGVAITDGRLVLLFRR